MTAIRRRAVLDDSVTKGQTFAYTITVSDLPTGVTIDGAGIGFIAETTGAKVAYTTAPQITVSGTDITVVVDTSALAVDRHTLDIYIDRSDSVDEDHIVEGIVNVRTSPFE